MDIRPSLIADGQPPILAEPGEGPFDHPAVAAQPFAGVEARAGNADLDMALGQRLAAARDVVGLVGVALVWPFAPVPVRLLDRWNRIEQRLKNDRVVAVGAGQQLGQRESPALGRNVPFGAGFAAIGGVGTDQVAPLLAGMLALSRQARLQSMRPASPRRSSSSWCSRSQTPACCQSRRRRQQVMPEPQPISWGSISQGMPDLRTKMMPVKQARSGTRGRPPVGLGGSGGSSGATTAHNSSLTRGLAMLKVYHDSARF